VGKQNYSPYILFSKVLVSSLWSVAALLQALVLSVGFPNIRNKLWGLQMWCNVGGVSFFFFCWGGEKKTK
jgi:hypothetical protein